MYGSVLVLSSWGHFSGKKLHENIPAAHSRSELIDLFKSILHGSKQVSTAQMCVCGKGVRGIAALTIKAHEIGPSIHAWPFLLKILWLGVQAYCSTSTSNTPKCWTHSSFRPTWMKKAYLWGLSLVSSSSLSKYTFLCFLAVSRQWYI